MDYFVNHTLRIEPEDVKDVPRNPEVPRSPFRNSSNLSDVFKRPCKVANQAICVGVVHAHPRDLVFSRLQKRKPVGCQYHEAQMVGYCSVFWEMRCHPRIENCLTTATPKHLNCRQRKWFHGHH